MMNFLNTLAVVQSQPSDTQGANIVIISVVVLIIILIAGTLFMSKK